MSHSDVADYSDWHSVTVSARNILWPCVCVCCGQNLAPMIGSQPVLPNIHAVKMDVATFSPFYCRACQDHQSLWHQAQSLPTVEIPAANSSVCGVYSCGCLLSPCIYGIGFTFFQAITKSGDAANALTVLTILSAVAIFHISAKKQEREKIAAAEAESSRIENERAQLDIQATHTRRPTCSSNGPTVHIADSYGARHKFVFVSEAMANAFAQINAKKVVY